MYRKSLVCNKYCLTISGDRIRLIEVADTDPGRGGDQAPSHHLDLDIAGIADTVLQWSGMIAS